MKRFLLTLALFALLLGTQPAFSQEAISFQGRLTGPDGTPVADDAYEVTFRLYADATGGSALWDETHTVETTGGVFSVVLGTETPLDLDAFEAMPYLALTIDGTTLAPLTPLTAVPYAMKSYRLDEAALVAGDNVTITRRSDGALRIGATGGGGTGGLTSVATDATMAGNGTSGSPLGLADGSVTGVKLSNNALLAGANVDIVRRGNGSWEISSTGSGGGGLTQVTSNATLTGEGTTGSPLAVQVPLVLTNPGNGTVLEAHNGNGNTGHLGGSDAGAYGEHSQGHRGLLGGDLSGALGLHSNGNIGTLGNNNYGAYGFSNNKAGVYGEHSNGNVGYIGASNLGVYGGHTSGTFGTLGDSNTGVFGENTNGNYGYLGGQRGAFGRHGSGNAGFLGDSNYGVIGQHTSGNRGHLGSSDYGAYGSNAGNEGYLGGSDFAVYGKHSSGNWAALGTSGFAGAFTGDVIILGNLAKSSGSFKIDHPLDPANKYLSHSFVESPDMMNVYNGNAVLDARGEAIVTLPDYFEALNRDFRYQLTAIGAPGPNLYIAEEISDNTFKIAGGTPGMKVSWLITGIRQDAWAEQNRIVVEEDKPAKVHGFYLHPKLFGQPAERSIMWAQHPEALRASQETPTQLAAEERRMEAERARMEQEHARMQHEQPRQPHP